MSHLATLQLNHAFQQLTGHTTYQGLVITWIDHGDFLEDGTNFS